MKSARWEREMYYISQNARIIVGLDEVGRGCWAGPIVAGAFVFSIIPTDIDVTDSKLLTDISRQTLTLQLQQFGTYGIGEASAEEIDEIGLQRGQYLAYSRAISALGQTPDIILLDGRAWKDCPFRHEAIVKGDRLSASIAAASILAKVHRDSQMREIYHPRFPNYGFDQHVGYGTKFHQSALQHYGPCSIHRRSFKPVRAYLKVTD